MMKQLLSLTLLWMLLPMTSQAAVLSSHSSITHSPNDHREYRSITLSNKLDVLLISDSTADKEAAAMTVKVGSTSDPRGYEGLAHFLEHMLFLGTKKYPKAGEYQAFISAHGGSHNAFTAAEDTNYFFDIKKGDLEPALDRFSQQFVAPAFTAKYVDRERNAVNSEYSTKLKDDGRRFYSVLKATVNQKNPYHKFAVGNLTTLSDKPDETLRERLIHFYKNHYSANLMKLVILGTEPLDTLQKWATTKFSDVPNHNLKAPVWTAPIFTKGALPALVQYRPVMNRRSLTLSFPIPSPKPYYRSKPTYYMSNIIGHEGKGSLLSYLKKQGLADGLSAGGGMDTLTESTFDINIRLTEKGLHHWKQVMGLTFDYIHLLSDEPIKKRYFDEARTMLDLGFRFAEKGESIHYVSQLASQMQRYPVTDVVAAGYMLDSFEPELYKKYLSYLNTGNVQVSLVSPNAITNKSTEWYQAKYSYEKMSNKDFVSSYATVAEKFHLPDANDFIPDNTELLAIKSLKKPMQLEQLNGFTAWYLPNIEFKTPKSNIFINIRSPQANNSAKHAVLTQLFTSLVNDKMNEFGYPANLAGLSYQIYKHIRGISIKIGGWSDKQDVLLSKVLSQLQEGKFDQARFDIFKERMIRSIHNSAKSKPYQQANERLSNLMITPGWTKEERLNVLDKITLADLEAFQPLFFDKTEVVTLTTGNLSTASALGINQLIKVWLHPEQHATKVPRGTIKILADNDKLRETLSIDHPDSGYLLYMQGRNSSIDERARYMLLAQILSSPYYENIRTENQLGYIVFASNFSMLDTPALGFIVESPNASPERIHLQSLQFLEDFSGKLGQIEAKAFRAQKAAIISRLTQKPHQLRALSDRLWLDIDRDAFNFDTRARLIESIDAIKAKDFLDFYREEVMPIKRALLIDSTGTRAKETKQTEQEANAFKQFKLLNK